MELIDMIGQKFGLLTVVSVLPGIKCVCDCSCGTRGFLVNRYSVRKGRSKSCGCLRNTNPSHLTHGESVRGRWTPEYRAWSNMLSRCYNPKATRFKDWGGRGISVCDEWRHSYEAFLRDVGRRPTSEHSLDRFPNTSGNYEPGNVRWATPIEQARNMRSNRLISAFSESMTMADWAERSGLKYRVIQDRIASGWDPERALSTPAKT